MKKYIILLFLFFISIIKLPVSASTYRYEWSNTVIYIDIFESIDNYIYLPTAKLYVDNKAVDCELNYNREGDWLYYLSNVDTNRLGEYKVWYKVYEYNEYKPGTCPGYKSLITFIVVDRIPPLIEVFDSVVDIKRGGGYDFFSNVGVSDNCDNNLDIRAVENVDFNTSGEYVVKIIAIDASSNSSEATYLLRIYSEAPIITYNGNDVMVGYLNEKMDVSPYFRAYDNIDGDISNNLLFPVIDTSNTVSEPKKYNVELYYNGFNVTKEFYVIIVDDETPILELTTNKIILDYLTDFTEYDFSSYILKLEDNNKIDYNNLEITHNLLNQVGIYNVIFSYNDGYFTVKANLEVSLISYKSPIIEVSNTVINAGELIDYYSLISVYDESDPNIYDSLEINTDNVDLNTPGIYYAEVYAINSSGVSSIKKIKVTVNEIEENDDSSFVIDSSLIYIGIISILVVTIIVVSVKKKKSI